ncbi:uncharacterized protein N0V89_012095 [Didymosphaeria variabile]|uniref:Uncharacterized protein n=1 Tax=Didymosphaeria variabile TaxID=1932322 RepID=A0A9W9C5T6_9PLEO|nr:uncharacterized protein N0V89_012095 [Didymosphaeria variabile]KAJ4344355.1 hypothetical protein N0V89_012095 [Didymosphaeria variabile]
MPQSQRSLHFIAYTGPPEPKQTPRRSHSKKVPPNDDDNEYPDIDEILSMERDSNTERGNGKELAHTVDDVEIVDSTTSSGRHPLRRPDNEANYKISGSKGESGDVSSDDPTNEREGVLMPTTLEGSQPAPSKGSSQGKCLYQINTMSEPTPKRKRGASVNAVDCKRYLRSSNGVSKQQSTNAAHAPKQQERYLSSGSPQHCPEVRSRADVAEVQDGEGTSINSSNSVGNDAPIFYLSTKKLRGLDGTETNHKSASNDDKYEVEQILVVHLYYENL